MAITSGLDSKLVALLEDSVLIAIDYSNRMEISFDIISNESDEWCRYYLYVREASNFYYQRYETSFQRTGFNNLRRLNFDDKKSEWIKELNTWNNPFTKENGFEIKLYDGEILRFVGSKLNLEHTFVEGPIDSIERYSDGKPDHIEQSKAAVVRNESFAKPIVKEENKIDPVEIVEEDHSEEITLEETNVDAVSSIEPAEIEQKIDPTYEEALDTIENLSDKQISDTEEIISKSLEEISDIPASVEQEEEQEVNKIEIADSVEIERPVEEEKPKSSSSLLDQLDEYVQPPSDIESTTNDLITSDPSLNDPKNDLKRTISLVNGVTDTNKESLENLGFDTIEKLAEAKITKLIQINGIGKATARKIILSAKELLQDEKQI